MSNSEISAFAHAIENQYQRIMEPARQDAGLLVGHFTLAENPALLVQILGDVFSNETGVPSFDRFKRHFQLAPLKPTLPKRDDLPLFPGQTIPRGRLKAYIATVELPYQKALHQYKEEQKQYEEEYAIHREIITNYQPTEGSFIQYIISKFPSKSRGVFFAKRPYYLPEESRKRHSYVLGRSGTGKSEVLKLLIHHYLVSNCSAACVVIDPHGEFARQVARQRENKDNGRLVFVDPNLSANHTPILNPFETQHKDDTAIDRTTQELFEVFQLILEGTSFTAQMETLLKLCIPVLLLMENTSIIDLLRFMDKEENAPYINFALRNLTNPTQIEFFKKHFQKDVYNPTKQSISTKLQSLLNSQIFLNFLVGKSSFNLENELNRKALIVFSLPDGLIGSDASKIIGRLVLAQIKTIAMRREGELERGISPVPVHVFVDECHRFITPTIKTILKETRKYKIHLTMGSQGYGEEMDTALKGVVSDNTFIKMTSQNGNKSHSDFIKETGAERDQLDVLRVGEFHIHRGQLGIDANPLPSIKFKAPENILGEKNCMSEKEWESLIGAQLARFYQPLHGQNVGVQHSQGRNVEGLKPKFEIDL